MFRVLPAQCLFQKQVLALQQVLLRVQLSRP